MAGSLVEFESPPGIPTCSPAAAEPIATSGGPASSIFPIHDIGELARRLMLRSLRLHQDPPRPHLHPLQHPRRLGTPTYRRWSPRSRR